jgi:hypothetical protein
VHFLFFNYREEIESLREIKVVREREMCKEGDGGDGNS